MTAGLLGIVRHKAFPLGLSVLVFQEAERVRRKTPANCEAPREFPLAISTRLERVERLFGLAPKRRFVSVQTFKCAAV
jgi:hypothetical protein